MLVAGIETVWSGFEKPGPGAVRETDYSEESIDFAKGDEIGRFKFGSTVILLFPQQAIAWSKKITPYAAVKMGQAIADRKG
jgi:phosphatidylserine decarboxylase